jgi:hypothetical protein
VIGHRFLNKDYQVNSMSSAARHVHFSKPMEASSNLRLVHIAKKYEDYRRSTKKSLVEMIDSTDYRLAFADSSEASRYLMQTGPHRVDAPGSELTRDELDEIVKANDRHRAATTFNESHTLPYPRARKFPTRKVGSSIASRPPNSQAPNPRKQPGPINNRSDEQAIDPIPAELVDAEANEILPAPEEDDDFPTIDAAPGLDLALGIEDDLPSTVAAAKLESTPGIEGEGDSRPTVAAVKLEFTPGIEDEDDLPSTVAAAKLESTPGIEGEGDSRPTVAAVKLKSTPGIEDEDDLPSTVAAAKLESTPGREGEGD